MTMEILSISDLTLCPTLTSDRSNIVDGVTFSLHSGEMLCIVGESGSGKSMTANSIMGLLPSTIEITKGSIQFEGRDLLCLNETDMEALRGERIAMIFQEPMTALNPLMRIGDQISEVFSVRKLYAIADRQRRVLKLIDEVGLPDPEKIIRAYPYQLSGGQRQRVMIAMALALEPKILIADEPTTALDVTTQAQILQLIKELQARRKMAVMFITHDFGVVADIADRVIVMRHGRIVETGKAEQVLHQPSHEYTKSLLAAVPTGAFADMALSQTSSILEVSGLKKTYVTRGGVFRKTRTVAALDNIDLRVYRGEVLGLVGESGSGKSTLGRSIVRLVEPDSGKILLGGQDMLSWSGADLQQQRRRIQMVFQDPYASLNPRHRIINTLTAGPIQHGTPKTVAEERAKKLLELVGLSSDAGNRYPHEFSGGQRQRIGIARALAMEPELIVADEAVSALDVSIQAQVLGLLRDLKSRLSLSMIFITHDLRVAAQICDRVAVMRGGKIVEIGPVRDIFLSPQDTYTKNLLASVPGKTWMSEH